ncbi:NAD-dependent epimerase/dehydratase family protein [Neosynechococcus sphagnicola]|uniref:NAD-dependent epimerase/dehydratase family protein n=1 Tax=Neosynechococcus sphagnicola TaxID=1501145 RepID=UPI000B03A4F8|nr:NAD-dependent epimerase/dehydratase family protein [Neosynechococcus sphagnicola]
MHVLVTGGAGFIGSHLIEHLLAQGDQITVVDDCRTGNPHHLPQDPRLQWLDKDIVDCDPREFTPPIHGLVHLAATASVMSSWTQPLSCHHNNLSASLAVLQLCQALQIPRLVFASSAAVYGNPLQVPIPESHPIQPISPYGYHKYWSEQYAVLFAPQFNLSCVALRLFNVFGPRQSADSAYSGVISIFAQAMQQDLPITIYGDGSQSRDFVCVKDVAIAFRQALLTDLPVGNCQVINIGTGRQASLGEVVALLQTQFPQWSKSIDYAPPRRRGIFTSPRQISLEPQLFWAISPNGHWNLDSSCS